MNNWRIGTEKRGKNESLRSALSVAASRTTSEGPYCNSTRAKRAKCARVSRHCYDNLTRQWRTRSRIPADARQQKAKGEDRQLARVAPGRDRSAAVEAAVLLSLLLSQIARFNAFILISFGQLANASAKACSPLARPCFDCIAAHAALKIRAEVGYSIAWTAASESM